MALLELPRWGDERQRASQGSDRVDKWHHPAMSVFDGTWRPDIQWFDPDREPDELSLGNGVYACRSCQPPYEVPADGRAHPVAGQNTFDSLAITVVDDRTIRRVARLRGDLVVDALTVISTDGREKTEVQTQYGPAAAPVDFRVRSRRVGRRSRGVHAISGRWRVVEADLPNHEEDTVYAIEAGVLSMRDGLGRSYEAPLDGTVVPYLGWPPFDTVSVRWLADDTIEEVNRRGDHVELVTRWRVDPDGKTMHVRFEHANGLVQEQTGHRIA